VKESTLMSGFFVFPIYFHNFSTYSREISNHDLLITQITKLLPLLNSAAPVFLSIYFLLLPFLFPSSQTAGDSIVLLCKEQQGHLLEGLYKILPGIVELLCGIQRLPMHEQNFLLVFCVL